MTFDPTLADLWEAECKTLIESFPENDRLIGVQADDLLAMIDRYQIIDNTIARMRKLEGALKGLVDRLDEIHEDPAYKAVFTSYMIHGGRYAGPTYVEALKRARDALKAEP